MNSLKVAIPAAVLLAGVVACASISSGTPAYSKTEKKACTYCHVQVKPTDKELMRKNLNATGTCYKGNEHSLAKCSAAK